MTVEQRVWLTIGALAGVPAVVLGVIVGLVVGVVIGAVVGVVVAALLAGVLLRGADTRVRTAVGGRPADAVGDARLVNLVDSLAVGAGIHPPDLRVLDDPALNVAVYGRRPHEATVVATTGLLTELSRIELEGILATAMVAIRQGTVGAATLAASVRTPWPVPSGPAGSDADRDLAAVGLTRYPPGLAAALDKMDAKGTTLRTHPGRSALLWCADPGGTAESGRTALHTRVEALREL